MDRVKEKRETHIQQRLYRPPVPLRAWTTRPSDHAVRPHRVRVGPTIVPRCPLQKNSNNNNNTTNKKDNKS